MEPDGPRLRTPRAPPRPPLAVTNSTSPSTRWHPLALLACFALPLLVFGFTAGRIARELLLDLDVAKLSARELFALAALVDVPLVIGTLLLARWLLRARPRDLGLVRPTGAALRYGVIFGVGLFLASIAIGLVQAASLGKPPQAIAQALVGHRGLEAFVLDVLSIAILTPIAEELMFRGLLFAGLRQRMPFIPAAVLATALFTAVHEPRAWPGVFVLGFGLALAYERTRTLWAPIVAHATVNAIPLLILAFSGGALL